MTTAAREAIKRRAGLAAVELWEKQHGRLTPEELDEARRSVRAQLRKSRTIRRAWAEHKVRLELGVVPVVPAPVVVQVSRSHNKPNYGAS